jgi:hypothetical protein
MSQLPHCLFIVGVATATTMLLCHRIRAVQVRRRTRQWMTDIEQAVRNDAVLAVISPEPLPRR